MRRLVTAMFVLLPVAAARAHDLGAEARLVAGHVLIEAYFDDDTPARDAKVTVTNADKQQIADGRTDSAGRWSFPAPGPGRYTATIDAGDGHKTIVAVTIPAQRDTTAIVSDGPPRSEFTKPRWIGLGVGMLLIAVTAIISRMYLRSKAASTGKPT